jgi:hypothetical protein
MKMNKLKNIIRLFSIAIVLSTTFFVSCSDSDPLQYVIDRDVINQENKIILSIIASPATRGVDVATAIGVVPVLRDMTVYFLSDSSVVHFERVYAGEGGSVPREMTFSLPQLSDHVIVFGNQSSALGSDVVFAKGTRASDLMKFQLSLDKQYNLSPDAVFVYGESSVTSASDSSLSADVVVLPSLSRIEISSIGSLVGSKHPVSSYTLSGIYIGNTYESLGVDQKTVSSGSFNIINYGRFSDVWSSSYPVPFHDLITNVTRSGRVVFPASPNLLWSYYVHPLKDNAPIIDGNRQGLVPHIILRFSDVRLEGRTEVVKEAFLTITRFINVLTNEEILSFDRGKVYSISSISFSGEHLSFRPETTPDIVGSVPTCPVCPDPVVPPAVTPPTPGFTVDVLVTDWIPRDIDVKLN